jgi:hypothetical protein
MVTQAPAGQPIHVSDAAWRALEGAYDLQVHVGPDVIERRIDDIDCARELGIAPPPLSVIDGSGSVVDPARRCLERIAKHNMSLATGHLGRHEIFALVRTAKDMGLKKVLVTHAEFPSQSLTADEQRALADMGAIIEHCFTTTYTAKATWESAFTNIRATGVSRTIISTDLGQTINPPVAEGFAMFAQRLLDAGFSPGDVRTMAVTNPTRFVEE